MTPSPTPRFTIYSTPWCHQCLFVKDWLKKQGVEAGRDYDDINIEESAEAVALVEKLNGGNRSVPTLVLADGTVLTEPSKQELEAVFPLLTGTVRA